MTFWTHRRKAVAGVVGSTVSVTRAPWRNTMGALGARASKLETSSGASKTPISGPRVSSMVAHSILVSRIAARKFASVALWYAIVPHEKSKRATFMPASSSFTSSGTVRLFTPTVHITFVSDEWDTSSDACRECRENTGRRLGLLDWEASGKSERRDENHGTTRTWTICARPESDAEALMVLRTRSVPLS